jgi:hypothetical protein
MRLPYATRPSGTTTGARLLQRTLGGASKTAGPDGAADQRRTMACRPLIKPRSHEFRFPTMRNVHRHLPRASLIAGATVLCVGEHTHEIPEELFLGVALQHRSLELENQITPRPRANLISQKLPESARECPSHYRRSTMSVRVTPWFRCKHATTIAARPHQKSACQLQRSLRSRRKWVIVGNLGPTASTRWWIDVHSKILPVKRCLGVAEGCFCATNMKPNLRIDVSSRCEANGDHARLKRREAIRARLANYYWNSHVS